jgi:hypothetical protein
MEYGVWGEAAGVERLIGWPVGRNEAEPGIQRDRAKVSAAEPRGGMLAW